MKKVLVTAGAMLLWTGLAHGASTDMVRMPADDYRAIMKQLDALQNKVDQLDKRPAASSAQAPAAARRPASAAPAGSGDARLDRLEDDINNIYDTLDQVETKTVKDRINFGAEYRLRYDTYMYENLSIMHLGTGVPITEDRVSEDDHNNWTNRFRINMAANISRSLRFHGRLALLHAWGDHDENQIVNFYNEANAAQRPGNNDLRVDRFYIDWIPQGPIPLAITVGRHPSSEGPPLEFKENRQRQSTYPALLFDGQNDGIVVTLGLERYLRLKKSGLRLGYGKIYHSDMNDSNWSFLDDSATDDGNLAAAFFETQVPGLKNSLLVLSFAHVQDMPASFTEYGYYNLGNEDFMSGHFQWGDIGGSGLDIFASYTTNKTDPNDTAMVGMPGLLSDGGANIESQTGWGFFTGLRFTIPVEAMNNPRIGFEYNHGSEFHCAMTGGSNELYNKLATRGSAYEVYWIQPASRNLFFRAGYTYIEYEYSGSGMPVGLPQPINTEFHNPYLLMDVRF
ncbi:MAG: DUF3373 family protein [Thermodesulfobacteriota bacterium]